MLNFKTCFPKVSSLLIFLALVAAPGCNERGESGKEANDRGPQRGGGLPDNPKFCKSIETIQILSDGKTVISRLKDNSRISWDAQSKEVLASRLPFSYSEISPDGNFALSKISYRRYRLYELQNGRYRHKAALTINPSDSASAKFSWNSKHVVFRYRPLNSQNLDQFDIYDIEREKYLKSFRAAGIKYTQMSEDSKSVVIGYDNGFEKYIAKYDLETLEEAYKIKLAPYQSFTYMQVAKERIVAKSRNSFYVYELASGKLLYQADYRYIYEVNRNAQLALATKHWEEVAVVDLKDGSTVFSGKKPPEIILSTCRMTSEPVRVVCKDRINQNKVFVWDLESGESVSTCY